MTESVGEWYCVRQRAGPLVKECRSIRPRLARSDSPYDRAEKNKILLPPRDSAVCRTRVDRLERLLALFGFEGSVYCLTFDDEHLPGSFRDVRRKWKSFLRRIKIWRGRAFDYVYLIEGRHGDHRYHIHLCLRDSDFPPAVVRYLWKFGRQVSDEPLLLHARDTYRRTAKYWCKEPTDGIVIPIGGRTWVASKTLKAKLPPLEIWRDSCGDIQVPEGVRCQGSYDTANEFGVYHYRWYIKS